VHDEWRHFQNGLAASAIASCRVLPMSLRWWSSSSARACRCRDRSEHRAHQLKNRVPHPSRHVSALSWWLDVAAAFRLVNELKPAIAKIIGCFM